MGDLYTPGTCSIVFHLPSLPLLAASESSPALDTSPGSSFGMQLSLLVSDSRLQGGEVNRKITRSLFWSSSLKSRRLFPAPYRENSLPHIFQRRLFPPACLDAPKGIFNIFSPKHTFLLKKKNPPAIKWQPSTQNAELLGNYSSCQLGWPSLDYLRVYKPRFVGLSGWEEIS